MAFQWARCAVLAHLNNGVPGELMWWSVYRVKRRPAPHRVFLRVYLHCQRACHSMSVAKQHDPSGNGAERAIQVSAPPPDFYADEISGHIDKMNTLPEAPKVATPPLSLPLFSPFPTPFQNALHQKSRSMCSRVRGGGSESPRAAPFCAVPCRAVPPWGGWGGKEALCRHATMCGALCAVG